MTTLAGSKRAAAAGERRGAFSVRGDVTALTGDEQTLLFDRGTSTDQRVRTIVAGIIARVRRSGDAALCALARELDGVEEPVLEVPRELWTSSLAGLNDDLRSALARAAANIRRAHEAGLPAACMVQTEPGVTVERRPDPLVRVGVYAPGGRVPYPSSVLMGVIPARVAGVREIVLCSPPERTGRPAAVVLAAAAIAGVDRVFAVGGAGAIAAMAIGTASVPRVDRIVGPGNAYVAEAKVQVAGDVATDAPAGPSELLVLADATTDPELVARESIAQAEHDPRAAVVVVVTGPGAVLHVGRIAAAITRRVHDTPRRAIVAQALGERGAVLTAPTLDAAIAFANAWAPEHVLVATSDPEVWIPRLRTAGTICVGPTTSVVLGDYMTGANHVLPTGGLARSYGGLSTSDFFRWTTIQRVTIDAARRMAPSVGVLADAERLPGHGAAVRELAGITRRNV